MSPAELVTRGPDELAAANRRDMELARARVTRLKEMSAPRRLRDALAAYDEATGALSDASARASIARNAHPSAAMRDAAEICEQEVEALSTEMSLDRGIYEALRDLDANGEDAPTRFYLERVLRDFRRAGVDRDDDTRARIRTLNEELVRIGQEFSRNIRDDVRAIELDPRELDGMPDDYARAHRPGPDGKVRITTDYPDYVPFLSYAKSSAARERLWRIYRQRGHPKNLEVLTRMLERRYELATLLGHPSWASYATEDKMIGSAAAAADFIARISSAAERRMAKDYQALLARQRREVPHVERVEPWDSQFLTEAVRQEEHGFDAQAVRPYFECSRVQDGVLEVTSQLFGLEYRCVPDAPVWHSDVTCFDVLEEGRAVGRFYLDLYPREGKYKHAGQFTLQSGQQGRALPEAALLCNFPRPGELFEHGEVVTFFHEFGHLLHHLFGGRVRWSGISGVRTEWDFVEAPSQMLEEWCWNASVLGRFARHRETGAPIPAEVVARMRAADEFGKGLRVRQQMYYAAVSLAFHQADPRSLDTTASMARLQEELTPFRYVPETYFHESFGHLEGYSALYYTYMWSLVIAKDLFTVFRRDGLMDRGAAARYRRAVLEPGGGAKAADLVRDFLGRDYDFRAYQEWLDAN
ncbi:MAG TPA: M3 family metallopeptidase [Myxococcales bacterium]|nr:M3 family metallopeptidase [Myxococcales bacterium]